MNFIQQPYKSNHCGQTCLAMITSKTVEQVCNELSEEGTTHIETHLQPYLNTNDYKTRLVKGNSISFEEVPNQSIIRLCYPSGGGHFIIKLNGKYLDPQIGLIDKIMINYVKITHYLTFNDNL